MKPLGPSSSNRTETDVVIIGYGPVGATLANLLGLCGLRTLVLEKEAEPYPLPRAVHFDDEVMRIFQTIGLAEEIARETRLSPGMHFVDAKGRIVLDWSRPATTTPLGWHPSYRFHQPDLERTLRRGVARWPGITVRSRCEAFAIDQDDDGATVRFEDLSCGRLESCRTAYVVGCDGARSLVRRLIGATMLDLGFHERWLVVDCLLKRDVPALGDHSIQYCDPARPATYVRGTGQRRRWEITALDSEDNASLTRPDKIWTLLARWITPEDAEIERAAVYTFHSVLAETWRDGRLLIAGDSAHQTPPFLGQGMCAGIRDAGNLAWKLRSVLRESANASLLDTYGSERAPHVREYIELAVRLGGLINTRAVEAALPGQAASKGEPIRMQSIRPRSGPGLFAGTHPLVGTLAPQHTLGDGRRLDEVAGYAFALLTREAFSPGPSLPGSGLVRLVSPETDAWLESQRVEAALVRPDRYVFGVAERSSEIDNLVRAIPRRSAGRHGHLEMVG